MKPLKLLFLVLCLLLAPQVISAQNFFPYSDIVFSASGRPVGGSPVAVCTTGLATSAAQVTNGIGTLTFSQNPASLGFAVGQTIVVSGFTGVDSYLNSGVVTFGSVTGGYTIISISPTTISFSITASNAVATSNGTVFQSGSTSVPCAPLANIYADSLGVNVISQPGLTTDGIGNYYFYAAAGLYYVQFYGPQVSAKVKPISIGGGSGSGGTASYVPRLQIAGASLLTAANFALSACWGSGANINFVTGTDTSFSISITAGTSPCMDANHTLTFKDGPWSRIDSVLSQTNSLSGIVDNPSTNNLSSVTVYYMGLPVAGQTYLISTTVVGASNVILPGTVVNPVLQNPSASQTTGNQPLSIPGALTASGGGAFSGGFSHSGVETFANINGFFMVDGVKYTTINAAFTACNISPGCHMVIPPGSYSFSTQVAPSFISVIEGAGAAYTNSIPECITSLTWTGGASAPFLISGANAQGSKLSGFCLNATGTAPPVFVDVDTSAGGTVVKNIIIDNPTVPATVAAFRWGNTGDVVDASCVDTFVRNAAPIAYDLLNVQAHFKGDHCRAVIGTNTVPVTNEWVIGASGKIVESFHCTWCTSEHINSAGNPGIVVNNAIEANFDQGYIEFGGNATSYAVSIPSGGLAQLVNITNNYSGGGCSTGASGFVYSNLGTATVNVVGNRIGDACIAPNAFTLKNDTVYRALVQGNHQTAANGLPYENAAGVTVVSDVAGGVPVANSFSSGLQATGNQQISGCSLTAAKGGSWAGSFTAGQTGCSVTITLPSTAPNFWQCGASDTTTTTDTMRQSGALSATTCTISGTVANSDVITWHAIAY